MKITEKLLLDNFHGITYGGGLVSRINGQDVHWVYRTGRDSQGYNCHCTREHSGEITLEYSRHGTIELDPDCNAHPALATIDHCEQELFGDEI